MCGSAEAVFFSLWLITCCPPFSVDLGDSQSPLLFVLVACIVNIIGDLILVAGLHMDAAGAAVATVLAQASQRGICGACFL